MLTQKIRLLPSKKVSSTHSQDPGEEEEEEEPEDILSSSLGVIFPDDITNQHGDATSSVVYLTKKHGGLELSLADPEGDRSRRLFSHFLWNSGVQVGVFIEGDDAYGIGEGEEGEEKVGAITGREWSWDVRGEEVLELGAGTGLAGLLAALYGAKRTVISDYPAPEVLANLRANVERNITLRREKVDIGEVIVLGHEWGVLDIDSSEEGEVDAEKGAQRTLVRDGKGAFTRILVADCLWMPWQHANLLRSIAWFLREGDGRTWVVAGFHTGREKMRGFFEEDALKEAGLEVEGIWERHADGREREWVTDRGREDITGRKRWLVIAVLKKI